MTYRHVTSKKERDGKYVHKTRLYKSDRFSDRYCVDVTTYVRTKVLWIIPYKKKIDETDRYKVSEDNISPVKELLKQDHIDEYEEREEVAAGFEE